MAVPHDRAKLRSIYLDDHWAGAGAGVALAKRLAAENEGTPWHVTLCQIAADIEADQQTLAKLRAAEPGGGGFSFKRVLAQGVERIGRLKLNGRLVGYSPLSRVLELEALMSGVQAKRGLWQALRQSGEFTVGDVDLSELERRAIEQLDALSGIHEQAARLAFGVESSSELTSIPR